MQKALCETKTPLAAAEDCLMFREGRTGVDLVHDNVERALAKVCHLLILVLSLIISFSTVHY